MTDHNSTANMTPCEVAVLAYIRSMHPANVTAIQVRAQVSFQRGAVASALLTLKGRKLIITVHQDGQRSTYRAVPLTIEQEAGLEHEMFGGPHDPLPMTKRGSRTRNPREYDRDEPVHPADR